MIPEIRNPIRTSDVIAAFGNSFVEKEGMLESFESDFAHYVAVPHARCVYSGRDGLYLILKALNLKKGNKIIIPAYTSPIVPMVLLHCGLKPVYAPVNATSFNISVEDFSRMIDSDTRAVIPIHMFGNPCQIEELTEIAVANDIVVIEDAAQALGAQYRSKKVGSFGDVALFSFGRGKNITTMGGGMIVTSREDLLKEMDALIPRTLDYGFKNCMLMLETLFYLIATYPKIYGFSCRLWNLVRGRYSFSEKDFLKEFTSYQATLGRVLLKRLDELNDKRIKNANHVINEIGDIPWLSVQQRASDAKHVYLRLVVRHLSGNLARNSLQSMLFKYGFDTPALDGYCPMDYLGSSEYTKEACRVLAKVKQEITDKTLALPTNPDLSANDLGTLVWVLRHSG